MKTYYPYFFTVLLSVVMLGCKGQSNKTQLDDVKDIEFMGTTYQLAWQSEPSDAYKKYEFLPEGQKTASYQNMFLIETLLTEEAVASVVGSQIEFLKERQQTDPVANYALITNEQSGEFLLDFVLSGTTESGKTIIEWNAYRYTPWETKDGRSGVRLYGYSERAYGDKNGTVFLTGLRDKKTTCIQALVSESFPTED